jgi:hypothetical protein
MKNLKELVVIGIVCSGLVGCAAVEAELGDIDLLNPTNINIGLANAESATATPMGSLPSGTSGSVTYEGAVAAATSGAYDGTLYAAMSMNVDFAGGGITGTVSDAFLYNDLTAQTDETLSGTLTLAGNEVAGGIVATASGNLTGVGVVTGTGPTVLVMAGNVRTDAAAADTVYGTIADTTMGGLGINLTLGEFYGTTP